MPAGVDAPEGFVIDAEGLGLLVGALREDGRRVIGPVVRDGAVVHGDLRTSGDLPRGWRDEQSPGHYRLRREGDRFFDWAVGPQSPKSDVFPPRATIWRAESRDADCTTCTEEPRPVAYVGIRPCEVAGLAVLDRVLGSADPAYERRRHDAVVVVAECGAPSGTCFCASMGTGPAAVEGFDLALTELADGEFLVRVGSGRGAAVLALVPGRQAEEADHGRRRQVLDRSRGAMGRSLETDGLPELLAHSTEHPRWAEVADRCLACGNCTLVCPTCFCSTVEDVTEVTGALERRRSWSSCFDLAHSYVHGGPVRRSVASRYRQWMTHKLSTWWEQFGTSGCVGCGRCITWCPVGIDITEEAAAIRGSGGERP